MNSLFALSRTGLGRQLISRVASANGRTTGCSGRYGFNYVYRRSVERTTCHRLVSTGRSKPPPPVAKRSQPLEPSTTSRVAPEGPFGESRTKPYAYPPIVNIYHAGRGSALYLGSIRLATITVLGCGLFGAVQYALDPSTPDKWLWAPLIALGATVPFLYVALATGPFLHNINVYLPTQARRSRATLFQFAANPPDATRLQIMYMRFVPWPFRRDIYLSDLQRMQPRIGRIANLRYAPRSVAGHEVRGFGAWVVRSYMGNFYVKRDQKKDLSEIPGVWEEMWKGIPYEQERKD